MQLFLRVALAVALAGGVPAVQAQLLISGNDEKATWDDDAKLVPHPPGKDTVSIIDLSNRTKPKIVANLPIMNSVVGPPTNVAITPDQTIALVSNSLDWVADGSS